jgi:hypothetical protein
MAYISRLSDFVGGGVAQDTIVEGCFVSISTSGIRDSLPNVRLAASGTVYPVFVAIVPPDNFPRPVNALQYTAGRTVTIRTDLNTGWGAPVSTWTLYRQGLSTFEEPIATSGMILQLHRGTTVTLTSGAYVNVAGIQVPGAMIKPADDGTGRAQVTTVQTEAVGFVQEYDGYRGYLTIVVKQ